MIHLKAIAGRIGVPLELDDWTRIGRGTPTLVDLMPSGRFLMEEFYYAGGLPAVLRRLGEAGLLPHPDALTVNGKTLWDNVQDAPIYNDEVIRPLDKPLVADGGICILRGNLAPRGAVLKPSAATPELLQHRGRAVVFENFDDYKARIDDPTLDVDASSVLVLKNCGPKGYPGMAEVGNMGLPPKLLAQGVTDMVRISDARMSGTAYGTVVLHVAPEARAGGPLAVVRERRLDRARLRRRPPAPRRHRRRAGRPPRGRGRRAQPPNRRRRRLPQALRRARAAGRRRLRLRLPRRLPRRRRAAAFALIQHATKVSLMTSKLPRYRGVFPVVPTTFTRVRRARPRRARSAASTS